MATRSVVNTRYQIENRVYDPYEVATRFHHQLGWIHAFPNGNGRYARFMADLLAIRLGRLRMSWGGGASTVESAGTLRDRYLTALRAADQGRFEELIEFARSRKVPGGLDSILTRIQKRNVTSCFWISVSNGHDSHGNLTLAAMKQ